MTSHYDAKKNCRVGTMDEKQFYKESDKVNGAFFKKLIGAWDRKGGTLKWGAGGVGLRCEVGGCEVGVCFVAPVYAKKRDRIELSCTPPKNRLVRPSALNSSRQFVKLRVRTFWAAQ